MTLRQWDGHVTFLVCHMTLEQWPGHVTKRSHDLETMDCQQWDPITENMTKQSEMSIMDP